MARSLACLRFVAAVAGVAARLASGWWGFTLPSRFRTGWVTISWFLSRSQRLVLHDSLCLVALPGLFQRSIEFQFLDEDFTEYSPR
jgi:hypothetical protein